MKSSDRFWLLLIMMTIDTIVIDMTHIIITELSNDIVAKSVFITLSAICCIITASLWCMRCK